MVFSHRSVFRCALLLALAGCTEESGARLAGETPAEDTGTPSDETPPWTAATVEDHVNTAFQFGWPSYPAVLAHHRRALDHRDDDCPNWTNLTSQDDDNWASLWHAEACTAETTGWSFDGDGQMEAITFDSAGTTFDQFISNFTIVDDSGRSWTSGGLCELTQYEGEFWSAEMTISGSHHYEDSGDWLQNFQSLFLVADAHRDEEGLHVSLTGGLGLEAASIDFHELEFGPECINKPSGSIGIRGPDGTWYDLLFDDDCSGCALLTWRDQEVGTVCLEESSWVEELAAAMGNGS